MRNQYFQLEFRDTFALLHIYPPEDGGKMLSITEVTEYLATNKLEQYNLKELNAAIVNLQAESVLLVGEWDGIPVRESMLVSISLDKMKVICRFVPPSIGSDKFLTAENIISDLAFRKVKFGIEQEAILDFLNDRKYCTDYVFAVGKQPIHGRDAKIEYFFNTNKNLQPKRNEDGSVDYKELNTISHVKKGDLLARLIKEDPGKPGKNVFGEEIKPRTVRSTRLQYGNKISINEDKTEIYSDVTGHANYLNEKVFVSDVFSVPADVDNSIGNIEYDGSVVVSQTGKKYYRGMLCSQDCSGHIKGYEWAIELGVTNYDACNSNSASFTEGCERGVYETYENLTSYCHDEGCDDYCAENYVDDYEIDREYYGRFGI